MQCIRPQFLKSGDRVIIISTARKVKFQEIEPAINILQGWGLQVSLGVNLFEAENQFAGNDLQRTSDLQNALDDFEIKAIFCARGGYGTPRIIDSISWEKFCLYPKWVVGFSDVTVMLSKIFQLDICSLHAPMPLFFAREEYVPSIQALKSFLFGRLNSINIKTHELNRVGTASGKLVGGNLSMIVNSLGTGTEFNAQGAILILEDIDEYLYHIDRMIVQLKRAGVLSKIAGLIIGHFSDMKDNTISFGKNAYEIIASHIAEYNYPVVFGFPFGHEPQNMPVPIGNLCKLEVVNEGVQLEFS